VKWLLLLLLSGISANLHAQAPGQNLDVAGSEVFQGLLNFHGVTPVSLQEAKRADASQLIVVIVDVPRGVEDNIATLSRRVIEQGGSVLIAVDQPLLLKPYLPKNSAELRIHGGRVIGTDSSECFQEFNDFPYLKPNGINAFTLALNQPPDPAALLAVGLTKIATNSPSVISGDIGNSSMPWLTLAELPPSVRFVGGATLSLRSERRAAITSSNSSGRKPGYRALIVSDPGVLSNQMLVAEGTENLVFANNVALWLATDGTRKQCLFVRGGTVVEKFDSVQFQAAPTPQIPPIPPVPLPNPLDPSFQAKMVDVVNESTAKIQDRNAFNNLILGDGSQYRYRKVLTTMAIFAAVGFLFWFVRRMLSAKHIPEATTVPKDTGRVASSGAPGSLARKKEELLERGDYTLLVREYLQHWFADRGVVDTAKLPEVDVREKSEKKKTLKNLQALWAVAYDEPRPVVLFSHWKQLEPRLQSLTDGFAAETWKFVSPKEPA
jgi:hypothetical protein